MRPPRGMLLLVVAGLALSGAAARADSMGNSVGPRATGVGEALRAASVGQLATSLNPAGVALQRSYVLEGTFGIRSQDKARIAGLSICDSVTSRVAACLYYDYVTWEPAADFDRRLHEAGLTLSMPLSDAIFLGVNNKYVNFKETVMGATNLSESGFALDGGLIVKLLSMLNLGVAGYNLVGADDQVLPRGMGGGIALFAMPNLMLSADVRHNFVSDEQRYGGGIEFFLAPGQSQQGFPLRGGYVYDTATGASYVTAGLGFINPRVALDGGLRKQVDGPGDELLVELGLRMFLNQ